MRKALRLQKQMRPFLRKRNFLQNSPIVKLSKFSEFVYRLKNPKGKIRA